MWRLSGAVIWHRTPHQTNTWHFVPRQKKNTKTQAQHQTNTCNFVSLTHIAVHRVIVWQSRKKEKERGHFGKALEERITTCFVHWVSVQPLLKNIHLPSAKKAPSKCVTLETCEVPCENYITPIALSKCVTFMLPLGRRISPLGHTGIIRRRKRVLKKEQNSIYGDIWVFACKRYQ